MSVCAIHTGMRAGRLAGLQWADIDWNRKFIMVRRSVKDGGVSQTKTNKVFGGRIRTLGAPEVSCG